ncbi:MAG: hypothetical protein BIFFINMI_03603 [Phycisphaerae bacterium]|nr:hypothetical protein [Phycisphaerae bacterium]
MSVSRWMMLVAIVLCAWTPLTAGDVPLGGSGYGFTALPILKAVDSDTLTLQMTNDAKTIVVQSKAAEGDETIEEMAASYHKGIAQGAKSLKLADQGWATIDGVNALYRCYEVVVGDETSNFQVLFFAKDKIRITLAVISAGENLAALKKMMLTLRPMAAVAPGPAPTPATPARGTLRIGQTAYRLRGVPDEFFEKPQAGMALNLNNKADDAAIQVVLVTDALTVEQMVDRYQKGMPANLQPVKKVSSEPVEVDGADALLNTYTANNNGKKFDMQTLFFVHGDDRMFIQAISQGRPLKPLRDVLLTLSSAPDRQPAPGPAPAAAVPAYRLHIESDVNIQFEVPAAWQTENHCTGDSVTFRGPADTESSLWTINLQLMSRQAADHRDIDASRQTLLKQVQELPEGKVVAQKAGRWMDCAASQVDYTLKGGSRVYQLRMVVVELPKVMLWLSFVTPQGQSDQLQDVQTHVLETLHYVNPPAAEPATEPAKGQG